MRHPSASGTGGGRSHPHVSALPFVLFSFPKVLGLAIGLASGPPVLFLLRLVLGCTLTDGLGCPRMRGPITPSRPPHRQYFHGDENKSIQGHGGGGFNCRAMMTSAYDGHAPEALNCRHSAANLKPARLPAQDPAHGAPNGRPNAQQSSPSIPISTGRYLDGYCAQLHIPGTAILCAGLIVQTDTYLPTYIQLSCLLQASCHAAAHDRSKQPPTLPRKKGSSSRAGPCRCSPRKHDIDWDSTTALPY